MITSKDMNLTALDGLLHLAEQILGFVNQACHPSQIVPEVSEVVSMSGHGLDVPGQVLDLGQVPCQLKVGVASA